MVLNGWLAELCGSSTRRSRRDTSRISRIETLESRALLSVDSFVMLANGTNGAPATANVDQFGRALVGIGDLDGDGVNDMAVCLANKGAGNDAFGAVDILFMNSDGTVKSFSKISSGVNGGPTLTATDSFATSVASLGDIDGDGNTDLAVGAYGDSTGGTGRGAVYILHLNSNGTVKSSTKIANGLNGGPTLTDNSDFGYALSAIGDVNNDGITDLAATAIGDATGAVYILRLNADGSVKTLTRIASGVNGGPTTVNGDEFGLSVASVGDLNNDGVGDLAVGAAGIPSGGQFRGGAFILFMNADGTVDSSTLISSGTNGGPTLSNFDFFGTSMTFLGDVDGDGRPELAVGAPQDDTGASAAGAFYLLNLNTDGTVQSSEKIASGLHGGPTLSNGVEFGSGLAKLGDLDGDGVTELAAAAWDDSTGGLFRGAVYVLFLDGVSGNISPTISTGGNPQQFVKGNPPVVVSSTLTLNDADTDPALQIPGGKLVISIDAVANKKHTKVFDALDLSGLSSVGTVGAPQVVNGRLQTTINQSNSATVAQIQDALRGITFSTSKKGLKTATRSVHFQVFDKGNAASNVATQTINVFKKAPPN